MLITMLNDDSIGELGVTLKSAQGMGLECSCKFSYYGATEMVTIPLPVST